MAPLDKPTTPLRKPGKILNIKEESQKRQDIRANCSTILYEDKRYLIGVSATDGESHNLLVNDVYAFLARGLLDEYSRANTERLRSGLEAVGLEVLHEIDTNNIPLEELGWALAKAALREEKNYSSFLVEQNTN